MYTFDKRIPVAIYGAGNTGRQILDYLNESLEYKPYFFIDDNKKLYKTKVNELYVFNLKDSTRYTEKYGIKTVIIANPKLSLNLKKSLIKKFEKNNIDVKTISSNNVFNSKEINISNISIQEILGREEIPAVEQLLNRNIQNKIVLITGAGGSIGTELCMQIIKLSPYKMICLDNSEHSLYNLEQKIYKELEKINVKSTFVSLLGSIQDSNFLKNILNEHKVSTIFHTAAYKHVPLIEENIIEGIKNNIFGTLNICNFSIQFKVQNFILISSDKAVRPTNFMGITKRISELICQSKSKIQNSTNFSIVRFGNVIGSSGSVIPKFQNQIENGGPVSVTHKDINRYFMTIREAAGLVIQASALGESGEVFVLDMGKPVKILDLAKKMIKLYGFNYSINTKQKDKILIEIVGLRKGEKISEELFISNKIFKTKHPRIYKSKEKNVIPAKLNEFLNKLQKYCNERNILLIKKHIKSLSNDFKI